MGSDPKEIIVRGINMKKSKINIFEGVFFAMLVIAAGVLFFIIYNDVDSDISFKFIVGYVICLLIFAIYEIIIGIINLRKLTWGEARKILFKFIVLTILWTILLYGIDYFFRPLKKDLLRSFPIGLGTALGWFLIETRFFAGKENRIL